MTLRRRSRTSTGAPLQYCRRLAPDCDLRRNGEDDQRLHDGYDLARCGGVDLEQQRSAPQRAEEQRGGDRAERTAIGKQRGDHAVEAEARRKTFHEAVVHAERLDAAGKSADRAGRQQDEEALPLDVDAAILGKSGIGAHLADRVAARRAQEEEMHGDGEHEADDQPPVQPGEAEDLRQICGRQDRRRLGEPARALEDVDREIGGDQHGHVVGEDGRDHLVGIVAGAEERRDRDPGKPGKGGEHDRHKHVDERRQVEGEADPGRREAAHEELPLDADVEQAAAQRDAGGNAADEDRRRLQQRARDPLGTAEGAAQQRRQDIDRVLVDGKHDHRAERQREQDRQRLAGKGSEPVAHRGDLRHGRSLVAAGAGHHEANLLFADALRRRDRP